MMHLYFARLNLSCESVLRLFLFLQVQVSLQVHLVVLPTDKTEFEKLPGNIFLSVHS